MIYNLRDIKNEIYWAYERVIKGWDSRIKWEFDSYFSQFIPPLKEFCEERLKEMSITGNEKRRGIYYNTLDLIYDFENMPDESFYKEYNEIDKMWEYIGKNLRWYWN